MTRVVAGVIVRSGRVLAAQRSAKQFPPLAWEFPGGKVEAGEDDTTALLRELDEELGIAAAAGVCLGENVHHYGDKAIRLVAYHVVIERGEPMAREHRALRWLGAEELGSLEWAPADIPLLPAVRALLLR